MLSSHLINEVVGRRPTTPPANPSSVVKITYHLTPPFPPTLTGHSMLLLVYYGEA
jgi:hypothetical protein